MCPRRECEPTCSVPRVSRAAGAPHGPGFKALVPGVVSSERPTAAQTPMNEE